jgi:tetratricopeptide (TPR) repeat protein
MAAWVTITTCLGLVPPALAQAPAAALQQQIAEIYRRAQQVQTPGECTQVLVECQALGEGQLVPEHRAYLERLQAWILNKRGELRAAQAEAAAAAGQAQQAQRAEAEALADFQQSIGLHSDYWRARHNRGVSLAMAGQLQQAIEDFTVSIQQNPDYKNSWFNRAEVYYQLGQFDRAESDYSKVITLDPQDAGAYSGRAHARFELQKFDASLVDYDQLIALAPDDAQAYADRADLRSLLGQWRDAAKDYRQAIRLDNTLARAYQNAAWMMATCPDERFRNAELAVRAAQRAMELMETPDYQCLDTLAAAQAAGGQFEQAQQTLQQALAVAPQAASADLQVRLASYRQQQPYTQPQRGGSEEASTP